VQAPYYWCTCQINGSWLSSHYLSNPNNEGHLIIVYITELLTITDGTERSVMSTVKIKFKTDQKFWSKFYRARSWKRKNCTDNSALSSSKQWSNRAPPGWEAHLLYFPEDGLTRKHFRRTTMEFNSKGNAKIHQHSTSKQFQKFYWSSRKHAKAPTANTW